MLTHSTNHFIIPLDLKVAIYTKFFSLCPLAAYMLLLLEAPRFKLLKSQAFKLFSSILEIYFGRGLYLWFSSVNLILHCSYDYYTQPFFLSVYISLQSMLQDPTPTFSYSCCLTIFIKKNLYFIFILFDNKYVLCKNILQKRNKTWILLWTRKKSPKLNLKQSRSCIQWMEEKLVTIYSHTDVEKNTHKRVQL